VAALFYGLFKDCLQVILELAMFSISRKLRASPAIIASALSMTVSTNEATARNFFNPFIVEVVAKVKSDYPFLVLAVEQDFEQVAAMVFWTILSSIKISRSSSLRQR
jgi:hypothetical protein